MAVAPVENGTFIYDDIFTNRFLQDNNRKIRPWAVYGDTF